MPSQLTGTRIARIVPTTVGVNSNPMTAGWHIPPRGQRKGSCQQLPRCVKLVPCGDGPCQGQPSASGVGVAPGGDVFRQHTEAGPACTQLQKEPYEIGCAASKYVEMACILVLLTAGRGAWSIASDKWSRMRVDDDIHWANGSEHFLSRRRVPLVSRTSLMVRCVKTE